MALATPTTNTWYSPHPPTTHGTHHTHQQHMALATPTNNTWYWPHPPTTHGTPTISDEPPVNIACHAHHIQTPHPLT